MGRSLYDVDREAMAWVAQAIANLSPAGGG